MRFAFFVLGIWLAGSGANAQVTVWTDVGGLRDSCTASRADDNKIAPARWDCYAYISGLYEGYVAASFAFVVGGGNHVVRSDATVRDAARRLIGFCPPWFYSAGGAVADVEIALQASDLDLDQPAHIFVLRTLLKAHPCD